MQKSSVGVSCPFISCSQRLYDVVAVTSAMRKNARWSGMNVSGLNMGGLGMSMGLRQGHSAKESHSNHQVLSNVPTGCTEHIA